MEAAQNPKLESFLDNYDAAKVECARQVQASQLAVDENVLSANKQALSKSKETFKQHRSAYASSESAVALLEQIGSDGFPKEGETIGACRAAASLLLPSNKERDLCAKELEDSKAALVAAKDDTVAASAEVHDAMTQLMEQADRLEQLKALVRERAVEMENSEGDKGPEEREQREEMKRFYEGKLTLLTKLGKTHVQRYESNALTLGMEADDGQRYVLVVSFVDGKGEIDGATLSDGNGAAVDVDDVVEYAKKRQDLRFLVREALLKINA